MVQMLGRPQAWTARPDGTGGRLIRLPDRPPDPLAIGPAGDRRPAAGERRPAAGERFRVLVVARSVSRDELVRSLSASPVVDEVHAAGDAASALRLLHQHTVDLAILEIDLPGFDGVDLARVLQQFARPPAIVFVADQRGRAVEAFEVGAVDFLLTPVVPERLAQSLCRVGGSALADRGPSTAKTVEAPERPAGQLASSVRWIEVEGDFVRVHTATDSRLVKAPLGRLVEDWAAAGVVRIHRSYAVQAAAVTEIRKGRAGGTVVVDGKVLPISRRAARLVKDQLSRWKT